jgi:DNA-binding response OmpR family regulator
MANKNVLIIEDDVFLGDVLVKKLNSAGFTAYLARDGAIGLSQLRELKPSILLLDIILPTLSGYDILEEKNKDTSIKDIPVIVISNSGQPVEIDKALSMGVKDYLVKAQFDPEEVIVKVKRELEKNDRVAAGLSGGGLKGKKVLWVEDDQFLSDIISRKLQAEGAELTHSTSGEEALSVVEKINPDVVVLDILLSGIDGFEILKRIKANDSLKKIPVILLSNLGQKSDVEKGTTLGAAKFLVKATMTLDEIVDEIQQVVNVA